VITLHLIKFRNFLISFEFYIIKVHFYHTWMIMFCGQGLQNFGLVFGYGLKIHYSTLISFFKWLSFTISCTYSSNGRLDRHRGLCGQLGALHTTVVTGRRMRD